MVDTTFYFKFSDNIAQHFNLPRYGVQHYPDGILDVGVTLYEYVHKAERVWRLQGNELVNFKHKDDKKITENEFLLIKLGAVKLD